MTEVPESELKQLRDKAKRLDEALEPRNLYQAIIDFYKILTRHTDLGDVVRFIENLLVKIRDGK